MAPTRSRQQGYELSDVSPALAAAIAAGLRCSSSPRRSSSSCHSGTATPDQLTGPRGAMPPAPRLEADPVTDGDAYRAREAALLGGYGWVDRPAGIVRMPIDEAMRILAERGRAGWDR